jgi:hypothetical protein
LVAAYTAAHEGFHGTDKENMHLYIKGHLTDNETLQDQAEEKPTEVKRRVIVQAYIKTYNLITKEK